MSQHSYETNQDSGDTNATNDAQPSAAHDTDNAPESANVPEPAILPVPGDLDSTEPANAETANAETAGDVQEGRELREV